MKLSEKMAVLYVPLAALVSMCGYYLESGAKLLDEGTSFMVLIAYLAAYFLAFMAVKRREKRREEGR